MNLMCMLGFHTWDGCKCPKCEKLRDAEHDWEEDICRKCGKTRPNLEALLSILVTEPLFDYATKFGSFVEQSRDRYVRGRECDAPLSSNIRQSFKLWKDLHFKAGFVPDLKVITAIKERNNPSAIQILLGVLEQARSIIVLEDDLFARQLLPTTLMKGYEIVPKIEKIIDHLKTLIPVEYDQFINGKTWDDIEPAADAIRKNLQRKDKSADLLMSLLKPKMPVSATGATGNPLLDLTGGRPDTPQWIALQLIHDQDNPSYDEYTSWICRNSAYLKRGWIKIILKHLSSSAITEQARRSCEDALKRMQYQAENEQKNWAG